MTDEDWLIIKETSAKLREALDGVELALAGASLISIYAEICAQQIKEEARDFEQFFDDHAAVFSRFPDFVKGKLEDLNHAGGRAQ